MIILEIITNTHEKYIKHGYDLYYTKKIDLYEYYYGTKFVLQLPNKLKICCIANNLLNKSYSTINTFGFYNPSLKQRGKLYINYKLIHTPMSITNKSIIKQLFHKKEIFIDPKYPIYNI